LYSADPYHHLEKKLHEIEDNIMESDEDEDSERDMKEESKAKSKSIAGVKKKKISQ